MFDKLKKVFSGSEEPKEQVEETIKNSILQTGQARDITVLATFTNLEISVMGEVTSAGRYSIDRDEITILDAISMARDLTIYGKRDNVKVLRMENGHQHVYKVNLCDAKSLMNSPVYYLKQNDIVYVEPNKAKSQNSEIGSMTTLWFSATSIGVSTSMNPCPSRNFLIVEIIFDLFTNVSFTSAFMIRSVYL